MNDLELVGKMNPQRLISLEEDAKKEKSEIYADRKHWERYGTNRKKKSTFSKPEVMEELSRKRFPWEE